MLSPTCTISDKFDSLCKTSIFTVRIISYLRRKCREMLGHWEIRNRIHLNVCKKSSWLLSFIIRVWSLFRSVRVYRRLHFLQILLENQFFCLSELFVFCACCVSNLNVSFLTLHNRYLHSNSCQVLCVFVLTYLKQFAKTDTRHKNFSIALHKNLSLESF